MRLTVRFIYRLIEIHKTISKFSWKSETLGFGEISEGNLIATSGT